MARAARSMIRTTSMVPTLVCVACDSVSVSVWDGGSDASSEITICSEALACTAGAFAFEILLASVSPSTNRIAM